MNMNLAPIKYRDVMSKDGGPIKSMEVGIEVILGREQYSAAGFLRDELRIDQPYPDGVGSASDPTTARFRAVSEALERWAFRECKLNNVSEYGFDYDPTSNGMGAFPGLFDKGARQSAEREAIERHILILWWEGHLDYTALGDPYPGIRAIQLENPISDHVVVLLWQFVEERFYTYGFGLANKEGDACWRAAVEMHRMANIIKEHYQKHESIDLEYVQQSQHLFEKRALFYSRPDGFTELIKRMESRPAGKWSTKPKVLIDRKVKGPWDQYVTVWRVVYEQPNREFASDRADYFFW